MILKGFLKKEIKQMLRNPIMVFALLFMPIVQAFLLSYAITNEPKNILITTDAKPDDYLVNRIYEHALSSRWFVGAASYDNNPFNVVQSGRANVAIVAPKGGFSKHIFGGGGASLQVLIDASNVIKAQSTSAYIRYLTYSVIKEELTKKVGNVTGATIIDFSPRILFNPEMDTKLFTVPAVMVFVVAMTILSLICTSISKEKEMGTMETLISSPIGKKHIILGKVFPAIIIAFFNFVSIIILGLLFFHVPFRGRIDMLFETFFIFCFAMSAISIFVSTFCSSQQQSMLAVMMTLFLMMMLSGGMAPVETMPIFLKSVAYANPLTHFIFLTRNIMLKGCNAAYFIKHTWPILASGMVFLSIGIKRFKQTL
ncbi:MAG: ABC transporter permease [Holosporales bacterium]|jgi:ABC-2 type transport system permease protein|nr:ABC transporter permease [Holosporales bacterium]